MSFVSWVRSFFKKPVSSPPNAGPYREPDVLPVYPKEEKIVEWAPPPKTQINGHYWPYKASGKRPPAVRPKAAAPPQSVPE